MKRAESIKHANEWDSTLAVDFVVLDAQDRHRRRIVLVGDKGDTYLVDFQSAVQLLDGDGLLLESGEFVLVKGKPEPLTEISAADPQKLARLAWHIGNRHTDIQFVAGKLRIRRDHVLDDMLRGLGASIAHIEASFDPETGAYRYGHPHGGGDDDR